MQLRPFLALAALLVLAVFFARQGIKSALAPLCALCFGGLLVAACGALGFLQAGGLAFYLLALAALLWMLWCYGIKRQPLPKLGFGFWFFALAGVLLVAVFLARRPMFIAWDEFSTWGTVAKLLKLNNAMYTTAEIGWLWTATQPPFLASLGYLVQFFGPGFAEWQHYVAIDLLLLAVIAALLAPVTRKHWALAPPLALIGFLTPFLFTLYASPVKVVAPWLDSLADVPMGFLLGGALAAWFLAGQKGFCRWLPAFLALAALSLTKDTAMALGLVAAVLMFLDVLAEKREPGVKLGKKIGFAFANLFGALFAVLGPFFLWAGHLAAAAGVNRFELGGVRNAGMAELFLLFFKDLFSGSQNEQFRLIMSGMPQRFLQSNSSMLGPGALLAVFILGLVALAAFFAKQAAQRRRCLVFGVFSALGFLPYFLLITLTYIYVFRPEQAFESFERYLYPYYIGWFLAAMGLLAATAAQSRFAPLAKAGVLGLSLLLGLRFWLMIPPEMSVVAFHPSEFEERRRFEARVDTLTAQFDPGGKTFVISTDDTGIRWFMYCYAFLPWQVDYSYGGGAFEERELQSDGSRTVTHIGPAAWQRHLVENGVTTVFIDKADTAFAEEYGELFSDEMQGYFNEETVVYNVVPLPGGGIELQPAQIML